MLLFLTRFLARLSAPWIDARTQIHIQLDFVLLRTKKLIFKITKKEEEKNEDEKMVEKFIVHLMKRRHVCIPIS